MTGFLAVVIVLLVLYITWLNKQLDESFKRTLEILAEWKETTEELLSVTESLEKANKTNADLLRMIKNDDKRNSA